MNKNKKRLITILAVLVVVGIVVTIAIPFFRSAKTGYDAAKEMTGFIDAFRQRTVQESLTYCTSLPLDQKDSCLVYLIPFSNNKTIKPFKNVEPLDVSTCNLIDKIATRVSCYALLDKCDFVPLDNLKNLCKTLVPKPAEPAGEQASSVEQAPSPLRDGYFTIKELGIKFKVTDDLKDLEYSVFHKYPDSDGRNTTVVGFASKTLDDFAQHILGKGCGDYSLGLFGLYRERDGKYYPEGYYIHPQDTCSGSLMNQQVNDLQNELIASLIDALKTALKVSSLGNDRDYP